MNKTLPDCMEEIIGYLLNLDENTKKESEEIKNMLRHIHNDVWNVRRQQEITTRKLDEFACMMIGNNAEIPDNELDKVLNLDPDFYSDLEELYSPIDDVDKVAWEEYMKKKNEKEKEDETGRK